MKPMRIFLFFFLAVLMTACYSHRTIGYLQEPTKANKLPVYDSAAYEPYKIRVNDEIIYRLVTLDETMSKMLGTSNSLSSGQYANSYRVYPDGTIELPFLKPLHVAGLTEAEARKRRERGEGNTLAEGQEKPISAILRDNLFTLFNLLNFALNLLGCYVHDLRLQCLEFFNRFYKDGGKPFRPLDVQTRYYNVTERE